MGCQTLFGETKVQAEKQVEETVKPELDKTICNALGAPIRWSKDDTYETAKQIEVLHNSQWVGFGCEGASR